jgi:thioredoxin-like negative regulator of GroEL
LALALGFALLLNVVLLTTFVWTELVAPSIAIAAWTVVAGFWLVSFVSSWRNGFELGGASAAQEDLFPTAVAEYLKGNWYDVEQICQRMLRRNDRDVDAQLLLATACRHTVRYDEAQRRLEHLATFDAAGKWAWEIRDEFERLKSARQTVSPTIGVSAAEASSAVAEQSLETEPNLRDAA